MTGRHGKCSVCGIPAYVSVEGSRHASHYARVSLCKRCHKRLSA